MRDTNINPTLRGLISNIQNLSLHDGPGVRTTVFLSGCPLSCKWCANPETWNPCKQTPIAPKSMTVEALISELLKQSYFFRATGGGVTFSGGEATVQIDFLEAISSHLYDLGIDMAIETSGYFDWQACHRVLERMDHLYFDLKMMDSEDHKSFCGVDNDLILKNLVKASTLGIDLTIRLIVIEGVHEGDDPFYKVVEFLKTQQIKAKLELMPYHRYGDGKYDLLDLSRPPEDYKTPTKERLTHLKALFEKNGYMTCFDL